MSARYIPPERRHARSRYADIPTYDEGSANRKGTGKPPAGNTGGSARKAPSTSGEQRPYAVTRRPAAGQQRRRVENPQAAPQGSPRSQAGKAQPRAQAAASRPARTRPSAPQRRGDAPHVRGKRGGTPHSRQRAEHRRILRAFLVAVAVIVGIGVVDTAANWGKIYPGVHIGDIDVSGLTVEEAASNVNSYYGGIIGANDINIYADQESFDKAAAGQVVENPAESENVSAEDAAKGKKVWTTNASELQARVDCASLAQQALAVGRGNGGLGARLVAQSLGWNVEPQVVMDDAAVENLAHDIDRAIGEEHVDYRVAIDAGVASVEAGHDGQEVNRDTLRAQLADQLLGADGAAGILAVAEPAPVHIGQDQAQAAADRINAAIACGATFTFDGTTWEAGTADLGNLIVTKAERTEDGSGWELVASYDPSLAKSALLSHLQSTYDDQNVKIKFDVSGAEPVVKTDASGVMPEAGNALDELTRLTLDNPPAETPVIEVQGTQIPASMTVDEAMNYGLITTISVFETEYTGGSTNRNTNIHLAADLINDSVAAADGGTWSFNDVAGNCNEEKGFQNAGTIIGGEIVDDVGGGICQVATTVFNAVYEAGLPVDTRTNHSLYMASYPAGRDAAVSWPDLDLAWHNDTDSDILLQTSWTDTTVTVTLLGIDPGYTVETQEGEFKDGAKYSTRTVEDDSLAPGETEVQQAGIDGSSIEVARTVKDAAGNIVRQDTFSSVYDAQDEVIAVGPGTTMDGSDGDADSSSSGDDSADGSDAEDSGDESGYDAA